MTTPLQDQLDAAEQRYAQIVARHAELVEERRRNSEARLRLQGEDLRLQARIKTLREQRAAEVREERADPAVVAARDEAKRALAAIDAEREPLRTEIYRLQNELGRLSNLRARTIAGREAGYSTPDFDERQVQARSARLDPLLPRLEALDADRHVVFQEIGRLQRLIDRPESPATAPTDPSEQARRIIRDLLEPAAPPPGLVARVAERLGVAA